MTRIRFLAKVVVGLLLISGSAYWLMNSNSGSEYEDQFSLVFEERPQWRDMSRFVSVDFYDQKYMSWEPESVDNSNGDVAWSLSYRMSGLNEMYRVTGDLKYLKLGQRFAELVYQNTDEARGLETWQGKSGPHWSSSRYGGQGRTVHLVHTAMITYPILERLLLQSEGRELQDSRLLKAVKRSLSSHQPQWREGPQPGEGHFVYGVGQKPENPELPLPINRNCAMAKSLWLLWKLDGDEDSRDQCLAIARYFKNRLEINPEGAYRWRYDSTVSNELQSGSYEDTSHAALSASLVPLLARDGEVFDGKDLVRFASTVANSVLGDKEGVIYSDVAGLGDLPPTHVQLPARWLEFAPYRPSIYTGLIKYYERYDRDPNPNRSSLVTALFLRFRTRPQEEFPSKSLQ